MRHRLLFLTPPLPQTCSTPIILLDSSTSSSATRTMEIPWGPDHPQWDRYFQREVPITGSNLSKDDHSQGSSIPSTVGSDYEDSDSRRNRSRLERKERHERNMNRPDNSMYRAIKEDQKNKKGGEKEETTGGSPHEPQFQEGKRRRTRRKRERTNIDLHNECGFNNSSQLSRTDMFFTPTLAPPDTMSYAMSNHTANDNDTLNAMLCDNDNTNLSNKSCFDVTNNQHTVSLSNACL